MIRELVTSLITIEGEPMPKGNIHINYKTKNIPAARLKNESARQAKARWDKSLQQKDFYTLSLKSYMNRAGIHPELILDDYQVWVSCIYYFQFQKSDNPALKKKDLDNCEKLFQDAMSASGIIKDDSQITFKMIGKQVTRTKPRIEILSIAISDSFAHFGEWASLQATNSTRRIYEHQIATLR